jgi:hypothetical protein
MKTAYCPKAHKKLGTYSTGRGGKTFHYVHVMISQRGTYRVHVVEHWGSGLEDMEEHGRREIVGNGLTIASAVGQALTRAIAVGMSGEYTVQAVSMAEDMAQERALNDSAALRGTAETDQRPSSD